MAKPQADEVQILRYFESESLAKATILFKIVSEKMRERTGERRQSAAKATEKDPDSSRKRKPEPEREARNLASPVPGAGA